MSIAIHSALAGLVMAGQRLEQGAAAITQGSGQPVSQAGQPDRTRTAVWMENSVPGATGAAAAPNAPSLADGLFAMQQAEIQYKASARLIGALNDMQKDTLDILG